MAPTEASATKRVEPTPYVPSTVQKPEPAFVDDMVEGVRTVHTELDYTKKDATRHIVLEKDSDTLRARVLRNLECVRAGKQILNSEKSLLAQSIASTNARLDRARARKDMEGIEEEVELLAQCEVCETVIDNEID